ncbi:MAG: metallophosphoesterase [Kiritimatiellae bacterium]|nr:metallophosphoesterase [Kiritimatiellia bacterium]
MKGSVSLPARTPLRRFWVFSDLQQSDPANARLCMTTGVEDFLSLGLGIDAAFYLGDSTEGAVEEHLAEMADMQVEQLSKVDAPIWYALGNHEFDLHNAAWNGRVDASRLFRVVMRERVLREPQWHVAPTLRDWLFVADFGDVAVALLGDHADAGGKWWTTHGILHGLPEGTPDPHGDEPLRVRDAIAALGKPAFTMSHYAFPGGNRPSALMGGMLPLPENVVAHLYGHCHIGDFRCGGDDCLRQIAGTDGSAVTQFDVASLENRRGTAVRSAILEWYGGRDFAVFFRNHSAARWEKAFQASPDPAKPWPFRAPGGHALN